MLSILKTVIPRTFSTKFQMDGKWYLSVWKMWLGRCYDITEVEVVGPSDREFE